MKRISTITAAILALFLLSCEKETVLTIDQTTLSYTDTGGSQTVSLTANKPWTAKTDQSWCKVSPASGEEAASSKINISCDANTTYDVRNCTVTFTSAELTKTVSISQATNNGLIVSQTEYNVTNAAQEIEIKVQANVKFSVDVDSGCRDWVSYKTTKGLNNSTVVLVIAENKTYDSREGKVTIKQDGGSLSSTVVIKQGQFNGLFITTPEYNLSNEKHTLTVEVKSNIDFEVNSEADWITYVETKGLKTNQIVLDIAANETYDLREGKVTVKQKNGDLSGSITIKQEQYYGLILSKTEFSLGEDAQTVDVEVKYNVEFDVVIPSGCKDWIKLVSSKGLNSRTYTFSIAKNETYDGREGSITFKQKNGALSGTVSVKQSQNNGLFVTKSDYEISNESQTINVELKASIDFEVAPEAEWIKVVETKGLKTSTITLSVDENDSYDLREGRVVVKQIDGDLCDSISIKQKGKDGIVLSQTEYELTNEAQTLNVEVQTTVQFEVQISDSGNDWVSLVSTKALDKKTCTFSIKKNETYDNRQCTVTFKQKGGEMSSTITIIQAQTDFMEVSPTAFTAGVEGGIIEVNVVSNIAYDVAISEDATSWISFVETKGLDPHIVLLEIQRNTTVKSRTGKVRIVQKNGDLDYSVTIRQKGDVPFVKKFTASYYYSGSYSWRETINIEYDTEGRIVTLGDMSISYTATDENTVIGRCEQWMMTGTGVMKKEITEMTIIDNLCVSAQGNWDYSAINQYDNKRIKQVDWFGWWPKTYHYFWRNENLVSWDSELDGGHISFDYYDYENPWQESIFDITSMSSFFPDADDYSHEWELGFMGIHSKNLIKSSYGKKGSQIMSFEYKFDSKGRISRITAKSIASNDKIIYDLYY